MNPYRTPTAFLGLLVAMSALAVVGLASSATADTGHGGTCITGMRWDYQSPGDCAFRTPSHYNCSVDPLPPDIGYECHDAPA